MVEYEPMKRALLITAMLLISCQAKTDGPPGGLKPEQVPLFICIGFDDNYNKVTDVSQFPIYIESSDSFDIDVGSFTMSGGEVISTTVTIRTAQDTTITAKDNDSASGSSRCDCSDDPRQEPSYGKAQDHGPGASSNTSYAARSDQWIGIQIASDTCCCRENGRAPTDNQ